MYKDFIDKINICKTLLYLFSILRGRAIPKISKWDGSYYNMNIFISLCVHECVHVDTILAYDNDFDNSNNFQRFVHNG